ncbi:MAG TPA: adenylate/guanylate cyclase domain-containing protein [Methylomirabilota bacterium]|jgi:adenylate cyclase|nr:adenylate/guanylate cyclase domain-containing protein [Methylomirabilota bacterium]
MASAARTSRWRTLALALGVVAVVGALYYAAPGFLQILEYKLYDQHFLLRGARVPQPQISIVVIDEDSLKVHGRWPWSRTVLADLVQRLTAAGAAVIAFDVLLVEPETSGEQRMAAKLRERLGRRDAAVDAELTRIARDADPDARLAEAMRASERVVLPISFFLSAIPSDRAPERKGSPKKSAIGAFKNYPERGIYPALHAEPDRADFPIPPLLEASAALGHVNMIPDLDGTTRYDALAIEHNGYYYPSLALSAVRLAAGIDPFAVKIEFGRALWLGDVGIPVDARLRTLVDYAGPPKTYPHVRAMDVLAGRAKEQLKDKIVFVGATAEATYDLRITPFSPVYPGVEKHANMAGNLLEGRFIVRPVWVELMEAAGILALPLLLALVLPALRPAWSAALTLGIWVALFAAAHVAFRYGMWAPLVYPSLALVVAFVAITIYRILTEELQRLWTKRAFQQYVSPEVVERIMQDPDALQFGGELRTLTVLFSDIRDFTTFTEKNDPQLVVQMLREYLTHMTEIVIREGGTLDKYIGDAVMAEFGAPIAHPDHALRGCRAALAMTAEVARLTEKWKAEGKEPFRIGLGVNTGAMVVGNLGSEQLFDYTVIGDEVNLGARLESLNKEYETTTHIIISEGTYEAVKDAVEARPLGEVKVKGKTRPVVVYELCGLKTTPGGATSA